MQCCSLRKYDLRVTWVSCLAAGVQTEEAGHFKGANSYDKKCQLLIVACINRLPYRQIKLLKGVFRAKKRSRQTLLCSRRTGKVVDQMTNFCGPPIQTFLRQVQTLVNIKRLVKCSKRTRQKELLASKGEVLPGLFRNFQYFVNCVGHRPQSLQVLSVHFSARPINKVVEGGLDGKEPEDQ